VTAPAIEGGPGATLPAGDKITTPATGGPAATDRPGLIGGIAAALTAGALVAGLVMLLARPKREGGTSEPADVRKVAVTDAGEPPPAAAIEMQLGEWNRGPLNLPGDGGLEHLVAMDDGFLAVGRIVGPDGARAGVWSGGHGFWQLHSKLDAGAATFGVPWGEGVLVFGMAEGSTGTVGIVWQLDRQGWRRLSDDSDPVMDGLVFDGAAALGDVVVAYGRQFDSAGAWATTDGSFWERARLEGSVDLVAGVPGALLAFGRDPVERRPMAARSMDGFSWMELTEDASFVFEGAAIAAVIGFDGGMVAAGTDRMRGVAAVWVSDDGNRWLRTPLHEDAGTSIHHLAMVGDRLVAVGSDVGPKRTRRVGSAVVWESTDGVSWCRLDSAELFANANVTSMGAAGGVLMMAGKLLSGPGSPWTQPVPVTWISRGNAPLQSFDSTAALLPA
jgi:hypothetical protein